MPSQATNYFYTLVAMGFVALMVTNAFGAHVRGIKAASERQELSRLVEAVASEATELVALTEATGATSKVCMRLPVTIGYRNYWIRLRSDSSGAWAEGGFGDPWAGDPDLRVELPWYVSASGTYKGGYGTLALNCTVQGSGIALALGRWEA